MNRFATLFGFIRKELWQTLRHPRMRSLLIMAPIIQLTLFGYALHNEVRNIKLGSVYDPSDSMASRLDARLFASGLFVPVAIDPAHPYEAVQSGQADAVFVSPPKGLKESINRGDGQVQLLVDATDSVRAQSVENYFKTILNQQVAEELGGMTAAAGPHLDLNVRVLYNPSMETSYFMVPGILGMLLLLVTMTLTSSAITREKEMGTFETLIAAPVAKWEIILGKTIPYVILGMFDIPLIMGFAVFVFGVPLKGPIWELLFGGLIFICAMVGVGTLVSTIAKNQQQAMMAGFLITFPAQLLSGIMYPLDNMPAAIVWIAYLNPLRYFVVIMRNVTLKGGDYTVFWDNAWPMALIGALAIIFSFRRFQQRLN
jgi:ABC-2 type transport system permease protein